VNGVVECLSQCSRRIQFRNTMSHVPSENAEHAPQIVSGEPSPVITGRRDLFGVTGELKGPGWFASEVGCVDGGHQHLQSSVGFLAVCQIRTG